MKIILFNYIFNWSFPSNLPSPMPTSPTLMPTEGPTFKMCSIDNDNLRLDWGGLIDGNTVVNTDIVVTPGTDNNGKIFMNVVVQADYLVVAEYDEITTYETDFGVTYLLDTLEYTQGDLISQPNACANRFV